MVVKGFHALNGPEHGLGDIGLRGVGKNNSIRIKRCPVMEAYPFPEMEYPGFAVIRRFPGLGKAGDDVQVGVKPDQGLIDLGPDKTSVSIRKLVQVPVVDIRTYSHGQFLGRYFGIRTFSGSVLLSAYAGTGTDYGQQH